MYNLLQRTNLPSGHRWPTSVRSLRLRIKNKAGWFWDNVTREHTIHFRNFGLPGVNKIKFTFVDPLFVWIQQCQKLLKHGHKLVWRPRSLKHPETGEEIYGGGVQYGLLLQAAKQTIPAMADVALMNISWDGGNTGVIKFGF